MSPISSAPHPSLGHRVLLSVASLDAFEVMLPLALPLASGEGGEVLVVHAQVAGRDPEVDGPELRTAIDDRLRALEVPGRLVWRDGVDASHEILRAAEENGAHVLAMTPERGAPSKRLLLGSVAEVLARQVRCLLLSVPVRLGAAAREGGTRALAVVAPGETPRSFLDRANGYATRFGLRLDVVEVDDAPPIHGHEPSRRWAPPMGSDNPHVPSPPVDEGHGQKPRGIISDASAPDVGLLIVAGRGHEEAADGFIGTHQERFLRRSPCPVLVVPVTA